jgi:N-methylhydantoinase A
MIAFGGGAPLHACRLADKTGISKIVVPVGAGVGSAIGFLRAPISYEITRSAAVSLEDFDAKRVNRLVAQMRADATAVVAPATRGKKLDIRVIADCRYVGQGHEIRVSVPLRTLTEKDGAKLKADFERLYEDVYGLRIPHQEAEAITWSVTVSSHAARPKKAGKVSASKLAVPRNKRRIYDAALGKTVQAPVYWRFDLKPGAALIGPAVIAEHETSTVVAANFRARINSLGYIVMEKSK